VRQKRSAGIARDGRIQPFVLANHGRLLVLLGRDDEGRARWQRARDQGGLPAGPASIIALAEATLLAQRGDAADARRLSSSITASGAGLGSASPVGMRLLEAWIAHAEGRTVEARRLASSRPVHASTAVGQRG
jgi:hypothetical protein